MADPALEKLFASIPHGTAATMQLESQSGQRSHLNCQIKESTPPIFALFFPPGRLPETVDSEKNYLLSVHAEEDQPLVLTVRPVQRVNERTLAVMIRRQIDPASLRNYFRVNIYLPITLSFASEAEDRASRSWELRGETLDLSGSGVLGLFPADCQAHGQVFIEMDLPEPNGRIHCFGHVVRSRRLRGGRFQIALHFDDIIAKFQGAVMSACFQEQRRQLRENVRVA